MKNLLRETCNILQKKGYSWDDVNSIQGENRAITVERFKQLANIEYDAGYGSPKVAQDLVILMNDGSWFSRDEYDGAEWWRHNKGPDEIRIKSDGLISYLLVHGGQTGWRTLDEVNTAEDEQA